MGALKRETEAEKKLRKKFWEAENIPTFATRYGRSERGKLRASFGIQTPKKKTKKSLQVRKSFLPLQSQTKREPTNGVRRH